MTLPGGWTVGTAGLFSEPMRPSLGWPLWISRPRFTPTKRDLYHSILFLAIYATISGYAHQRFGGSDEFSCLLSPVDFLVSLKDIHEIVYLGTFALFASTLIFAMYLPVFLTEKKKHSLNG
jgi:hypothetical protein